MLSSLNPWVLLVVGILAGMYLVPKLRAAIGR